MGFTTVHFVNNKLTLPILVEEVIWNIFCFGWTLSAEFLFLIICYKTNLIEIRLDSPETNPEHIFVVRNDPEILITRIEFLIETKTKVNSILGLLPFLWFTDLFQSTCLRLTYLGVSEKAINWLLRVEPLLEFSQLFVFYLVYIFAMSVLRKRQPECHYLLKRTNEMNRSYYEPMRFYDSIYLTETIKIYSNTEYKGWGILTINKNFLFTHLSFIITFTVMAVQIVDQFYKK